MLLMMGNPVATASPPLAKYFVDSRVGQGGSDGNSGLAPGDPWLTLDHALANAVLSAGENISFARGGTYVPSATMVDPWASQVGVTAFGVGQNPLFDFRALASGMTLSAVDGQTWTDIDFLGSNTVTDNFITASGPVSMVLRGMSASNCANQIIQANHVGCAITIEDSVLSGAVDETVSGHDGSLTVRRSSLLDSDQGINTSSATGVTLNVEDCVIGGCRELVNLDPDDNVSIARTRFYGRTGLASDSFFSGSLKHCVFDASRFPSAAGLVVRWSGNTDVQNCSFYGQAGGVAGDLRSGAFNIQLTNSLFENWFRTMLQAGGALNFDHSIYRNCSTIGSTTNTNEVGAGGTAAILVDPTGDNWTPTAGSDAIGAGVHLGASIGYGGGPVTNPPNIGAV